MNQQSYLGCGSHRKLGTILESYEPTRVFLVTGRESFNVSGARECISPMVARYNYIRFCDFRVNPQFADVKRGVRLFREKSCDFVVGIGGGSVLDVAKAVALLASDGGSATDVSALEIERYKRRTPIVLIPTTAGTGSEATHFATVYEGKAKRSLSNETMKADHVILDPTFTQSLPAYLSACTGMDALCQAIEAFWSNKSTETSREHSRRAIVLLMAQLTHIHQGTDLGSGLQMLEGSNWSGRAIDIAKTTGPHSVSYAFTTEFAVPHGHAVALTLPYFFVFNYGVDGATVQDGRGVDFVKKGIDELAQLLGVRSPDAAKARLLELMEAVGLKTTLAGCGITGDAVEIIVRHGFDEERMGNNPRRVSGDDLRAILGRLPR